MAESLPKQDNRRIECSTTCSTTNNKQQTKSFVTSLIVFGQKISIRITPDRLETWTTFFNIAKERRIKVSKLTEQALIEYVKNHSAPGSQLKLSPYLPGAQTSPVRVLCWNLAGVTTEGKVYCRKAGQSVRTSGGAWILGVACYSCKDNQLRKEKRP